MLNTVLESFHLSRRLATIIGVALLVFGIPALAGFLFGGHVTFADLGFNQQFVGPQTKTVTVEVREGGTVLVNGKRVYRMLRPRAEGVELRLPVVEQSGFGIDVVQVLVNVPRNLTITTPSQVQAMVVSEHGVERTAVRLGGPHQVIYEAYEISPVATVTVVAQFPPGVVQLPLLSRIIFASPALWVGVSVGVLAITVLVLCLALLRQFRTNRVPSSKRLLTAPPMALPPAVAGALVDGKVGAREVAATFVDLANRGFLYISRKGDDFVFAKRKEFDLGGPVSALADLPLPGIEEVMPPPPAPGYIRVANPDLDPAHRLGEPAVGTSTDLRDFERKLLSKIFTSASFRSSRQDIDLRVGRHVFSRRIAHVYWGMYQEATNLGYFEENPSKVHIRYRGVGIALFFLGMIGLVAGLFIPDPKYPLLLWIATLLAATLVIGTSGFLSVHTPGGRAATEIWLAFRNFLANESPITYSPGASELFARYLPYAIAMGVEVEWAQRFLNVNFHPPDWFNATESLISLENFVGQMFPIVRGVAEIFAEAKEPVVQ